MNALFFHFLCNRLIIRDAFLCFFYTVGLIHDVFITCYFTAYKVTIFLGYNQKNSEKIGIFSLEDGTLCLVSYLSRYHSDTTCRRYAALILNKGYIQHDSC